MFIDCSPHMDWLLQGISLPFQQASSFLLSGHWIAWENSEMQLIMKANLHSNVGTSCRTPLLFSNGLAELPQDS